MDAPAASASGHAHASSPPPLDGRAQRELSHLLSKILRHTAPSLGLTLDSAGYAKVPELLALPALRRIRPPPSLQSLQYVAAVCPKQRFGLRQDPDTHEWMVRANQGHNAALAPRLDAEAMMQPLRLGDDMNPLPSVCVHGTSRAGWSAILASGGLHPMGRSHIHFSARDFGDASIVSGMRKSSEVLIYVDVARCLQWATSPHTRARSLHLDFWRSANDVLLTSGVAGLGSLLPSFLFDRVEEVLHGERGRGCGGPAFAKARRAMPGWSPPTEEEWMEKFGTGRRAAADPTKVGAQGAHASAAPAAASSAAAASSSQLSAASPAPASSSAVLPSPQAHQWGPPPTSRPPPGWQVPPHLQHYAREAAIEAQVAAAQARAEAEARAKGTATATATAPVQPGQARASALKAALQRNQGQPTRVQS